MKTFYFIESQRDLTLSIEESSEPETFRSIFEDPLGELVITLEQLSEPEADRRRRPRHFAPQVGYLGVEHAVQCIAKILNAASTFTLSYM